MLLALLKLTSFNSFEACIIACVTCYRCMRYNACVCCMEKRTSVDIANSYVHTSALSSSISISTLHVNFHFQHSTRMPLVKVENACLLLSTLVHLLHATLAALPTNQWKIVLCGVDNYVISYEIMLYRRFVMSSFLKCNYVCIILQI